jgi:hypothetical protein
VNIRVQKGNSSTINLEKFKRRVGDGREERDGCT